MRTKLILFLLCLFTLSAVSETGPIRKVCSTCKKPVANCPYKGKHPEPEKKCATCGKPLSQCKGHEKKCATCGKPLSQCKGHEKNCATCGKPLSQCKGHEKNCATCGKPLSQCKGHEKNCATCGKPLSQCKGHEKNCATCGKPLSQCPHKGKHPAPEAAGYDVTFSCNVSTASLYIDGTSYGNVTGTRFLKTGSHSIKVTASGYEDYAGNMNVNRQNKTCSITLQKIPEPVITTTGTVNGHEWVDLGLPSGTKWATTNVGASSPSDYGDYFAWGETSTKRSYTWSNLTYCLDSKGKKFSKYVTKSKYGTVDGKSELDPSDDAAYVNWGSGWRMPSKTQQDELREKCNWTWTTMGGHNGYKVVGPNGNSLFLPAAGYRYDSDFYNVGSYGYYWSRSLFLGDQWGAYYLYFHSSYVYWNYNFRRNGRCVRPVLGS